MVEWWLVAFGSLQEIDSSLNGQQPCRSQHVCGCTLGYDRELILISYPEWLYKDFVGMDHFIKVHTKADHTPVKFCSNCCLKFRKIVHQSIQSCYYWGNYFCLKPLSFYGATWMNPRCIKQVYLALRISFFQIRKKKKR